MHLLHTYFLVINQESKLKLVFKIELPKDIELPDRDRMKLRNWTMGNIMRTPGGHEHGHGDGGVVVEDAGETGEVTAVTEMTVVTEPITLGTHDVLWSRRVADVIPTTNTNTHTHIHIQQCSC